MTTGKTVTTIRKSRSLWARCGFALGILLACLLAGASPRRARAADDLSLSASMELSQIYRPGVWQPVRVEFRNPTDRAIDGTAVLPLGGPHGPAVMTLPVHVPARSRTVATLSGYFPSEIGVSPSQRKRGDVPPITTAEWRGPDGAILAKSEVLGVPISSTAGAEGSAPGAGELILVLSQRPEAAGAEYDAAALVGRLKKSSEIPMTVAAIGFDALARHAAALRPIKAIVMDAVDPDALDASQRQAIEGYLRGGGTVIISAPERTAGTPGTWLDALLPVRYLSTRQATGVTLQSPDISVKFSGPVEVVEAIERPDTDVLLRDAHYVHVAARSVGLGRLVFTSFPINALDVSETKAAALWKELFSLTRPQWEWSRSVLGERRYPALAGAIGKKVAAWSVAATFAGAYVLLLIASQFLFRGTSRPKAFALSLIAAGGMSAILLVMGMTRRADQSLQVAALDVIDVAPDGGGWRHSSVALAGADLPDLALRSVDDGVTVRPAVSEADNRPHIRQQPFVIDKAGVSIEHIDRIWEAEGPVESSRRVAAVGKFGPGGLALSIDNGFGAKLESPLLAWNGRGIGINRSLESGNTDVDAFRVNARGDYAGGSGVVTTDQDIRRAHIAKAAFAPPADDSAGTFDQPLAPPTLIAWVPAGALPGLLTTGDVRGADFKFIQMVRTPIRIQSPKPGTKLSVPSAYVSISPGRMPYDLRRGESVPSQQPGTDLVGFAVPAELGQIRPMRVTLEVRVTLPGHTIEVRRGQCAGGKPTIDRNGALIAEWSAEVGSRKVSFDCAAGDFDIDGRVWLLFDVRPADSSGSTQVSWQIQDLGLSFDDAEAVAPPRPITLDTPPASHDTGDAGN